MHGIHSDKEESAMSETAFNKKVVRGKKTKRERKKAMMPSIDKRKKSQENIIFKDY